MIYVVAVVAVLLALGLSIGGAEAAIPRGPALSSNPAVPYFPLFLHFSALHGVPVRLGVSIVAHESAFDPRAVNLETAADKKLGRNVDSLGLGQILYPDTAEQYSPGISRDDLFDPETNLSICFQVLRDKLKRYPRTALDGLPEDAVSAYNAGKSLRNASGGFGNQDYVDAVREKWGLYGSLEIA